MQCYVEGSERIPQIPGLAAKKPSTEAGESSSEKYE